MAGLRDKPRFTTTINLTAGRHGKNGEHGKCPPRALVACVLLLVALFITLLPSGQARATEIPLVPVYRLYNEWTGGHIISADDNEVQSLVDAGWKKEGIAFYARPYSPYPVYRLYNPYNGGHHYTIDFDEYLYLQGLNWQGEGAKFYTVEASDQPVFRLYNPYMTENGGPYSHLWTSDYNEYAANIGLGWKGEDVAWYAVDPSHSGATGSSDPKPDPSEWGDQQEATIDPDYNSSFDYQDDVDVASNANYVVVDGVILANVADLPLGTKIGDIVALSPTDENPQGAAMRVDEIVEGVAMGTVPEFDETFETIDLEGVLDGGSSPFVPAAGVEVLESSEIVEPLGIEEEDHIRYQKSFYLHLKIPDDFESGGVFGVAFDWINKEVNDKEAAKLRPFVENFLKENAESAKDGPSGSIDADLEVNLEGMFSIDSGYKFYFDVFRPEDTIIYLEDNLDFNCDLDVDGKAEGKIKLGVFPIPTPAVIVTAPIEVYLVAEADGTMAIGMSYGASSVVNWSARTTGRPTCAQTNVVVNQRSSIEAEYQLGVGVDVGIAVLSCNVYDVGLEADMNYELNSYPPGNPEGVNMSCLQQDGWFGLDFHYGDNSPVVDFIESAVHQIPGLNLFTLSGEIPIIDEEHSPYKLTIHWEDGTQVTECTLYKYLPPSADLIEQLQGWWVHASRFVDKRAVHIVGDRVWEYDGEDGHPRYLGRIGAEYVLGSDDAGKYSGYMIYVGRNQTNFWTSSSPTFLSDHAMSYPSVNHYSHVEEQNENILPAWKEHVTEEQTHY